MSPPPAADAVRDPVRGAFEIWWEKTRGFKLGLDWIGDVGYRRQFECYAAGVAAERERAKPKLVERGTADTVKRPIYIPEDSWAESLEQYQLQEDELMDDELPTADQRYLMIHQYAMAHRDLKTYRSQGGPNG